MPKHKPANLGIEGKKAVLEFYKSFRGKRQTALCAPAIVQEPELLLMSRRRTLISATRSKC